jgi:hypothetical protein
MSDTPRGKLQGILQRILVKVPILLWGLHNGNFVVVCFH